MSILSKAIEKANIAQPEIFYDEGEYHNTSQSKLITVREAFENIEVVNRAVNMLIDNSAMIDFDVQDRLDFSGNVRIEARKLNRLLNKRPNIDYDINSFRRLSYKDFILTGRCFWHYDGSSFFYLPEQGMEIIADEKGYIDKYIFDSKVEYRPNEILFIRDNSIESIYKGYNRINPALESLQTRHEMLQFQNNYYKSGTSIGMVVETDEILSRPMKEKLVKEWVRDYNPKRTRGRPLVLDNGLKAKLMGNGDFRSQNFLESIESYEDKVLLSLGIPPILVKGGNNANIKPNLELFFHTTVIPMLRKFEAAIEFFFAFDVQLNTHRVPALKPDQKAEAERVSALVNNGLLTGNEGREILRYPAIPEPEMENIRLPANIAGSGTGVTGQEGGRPEGEE